MQPAADQNVINFTELSEERAHVQSNAFQTGTDFLMNEYYDTTCYANVAMPQFGQATSSINVTPNLFE